VEGGEKIGGNAELAAQGHEENLDLLKRADYFKAAENAWSEGSGKKDGGEVAGFFA